LNQNLIFNTIFRHKCRIYNCAYVCWSTGPGDQGASSCQKKLLRWIFAYVVQF